MIFIKTYDDLTHISINNKKTAAGLPATVQYYYLVRSINYPVKMNYRRAFNTCIRHYFFKIRRV